MSRNIVVYNSRDIKIWINKALKDFRDFLDQLENKIYKLEERIHCLEFDYSIGGKNARKK